MDALDLEPDERILFSASPWPGLIDFARARPSFAFAVVVGLALWTLAFLPLPIWPAESTREAWTRQAAFTLAGLCLCLGLGSKALQLRRTRYVITTRRAGILLPGRDWQLVDLGEPALRRDRATLHVTWPGLTFDLPAGEEVALLAVLTELGLLEHLE